MVSPLMRFPRLLLSLTALCLTAAPLGASELWIYCPTNLLVDENVGKLEALWRRASAAGYTHVLLADSKLAKLDDLGEAAGEERRPVA